MYAYASYKKGFLMGSDDKYHKVSDEIWSDYMRSVWREDATEKREHTPVIGKNNTDSAEKWGDFPKVGSIYNITAAHAEQILPNHRSAEDEVVAKTARNDIHNRLKRALKHLDPDELALIDGLYFEDGGLSIRAYADKSGEPRTTIQYRHKKILKKLKGFMEREAGFSPDMIHEALGYGER